MHPAVVLILLPAGYELAGIIGLLAVVPVAAVVIAVASAVVSVVQPEPAPPLPEIVPGWLDRFAQWSWRVLVIIGLITVVVGAAVLMPLVVTPIVVALVVTATLDPLVSALVRRGWGRTLASVSAVLASTGVVVALLVLAALSLMYQGTEVATGVEAGARSIDSSSAGVLGLGVESVVQLIRSAERLVGVASALGTFAVVIGLGLLLAVAFLSDGARLWARIVGRAPVEHRPALDGAGSRALGVLGGYMIGTAAISGVGAASQWLIMVVLGIPLALPVAVLSFILCFIPYIGGFLSTGIAFLLTVAYGSPLDIGIMVIWTVVFNIVQGNIVSPLVYGRTVSLHPAVVLMAIPAAAAVAGMVGMFLVVPALGVVAATWRPVLALLAGAVVRNDALASRDAPEPSPALSAG
jgi:predicted PurR-regulated permease PerM